MRCVGLTSGNPEEWAESSLAFLPGQPYVATFIRSTSNANHTQAAHSSVPPQNFNLNSLIFCINSSASMIN